MESEIAELKDSRKKHPKHITLAELHGQSNPAHDKAVEHLCAELNQNQTQHPAIDLTLYYRPWRSANFLPNQDV